MNNFSLLAANRLTHLKVMMLALACATLVVGFGLVHSASGAFSCRPLGTPSNDGRLASGGVKMGDLART